MSFNQKYFRTLYAKNETIDGDFNAKEHAFYLKSLFELMGYHPTKIYDFGFGKGTLLKAVSANLGCTQIGGCDISVYALQKLQKKSWAKNWKLELSEIYSIKKPKMPYHLGLCNSVLQYLETKDIEKSLKIMAQYCKYVYLHVPTTEDYKILKKDLKFEDAYASHRTNAFYKKLISKYFTSVSWGLLESKKYSRHSNSIFTDSIYRF